MGSQEFIHWLAFYRLDPFGGYRQDINFADLKALLANVNRPADSDAYKASDFVLYERMPTLNQTLITEDDAMTADEMSQNLLAFFGVPDISLE